MDAVNAPPFAPSIAAAPDADAIAALAAAALESLPALFRPHLDGVLIEIADLADDDLLAAMGIEHPYDLTGLYSGRALPLRGSDTSGIGTDGLPDRITLYRIPILIEWIEGGERLDWLVRHVLVHEIGHHFGLSDDDIDAIEAAP